MAWRIIRQPNGLFARFSEVVDDVTHYAMTAEQAVWCCESHGLSRLDARAKVRRGLDEPSRYRAALRSIRFRHGRRRMLRRRRGMEQVLNRLTCIAAPVPCRRSALSFAERTDRRRRYATR
jgi:hypothetical protein